jgi:phosphopantothenoylcysteine synthetase/decarboxylase
MMRILVTAGNTQAPIDKVRCLTNIFTGRTGAAIAAAALRRGHVTTLLTSAPFTIFEFTELTAAPGWEVDLYSTFDDLQRKMERHITMTQYDVIVHSAAVSDYLCAGVYALDSHTRFDPQALAFSSDGPREPRLVDRQAGKVKSNESELWLRLVRAPKLVDRIRRDWRFAGVLVKFKLEVGVSDERLLEIAEASRAASQADLMVANTREGAEAYAFLGPLGGRYERIARPDLPLRLVNAVEGMREGS